MGNAYFLSHASAHKPFCDQLRAALEALGHHAWLDAYDLHGGASIPGAIADGIYACDYFVLVVTPEVHKSLWVPWELNLAAYREVQILRRDFVVPALREPTLLPRLVAHKSHVDVQCDPATAATRLVAARGAAAPVLARALPKNAVKLTARLFPKPGKKFSTRKLEEAFWGASVGREGKARSFPLANRYHGVSVAKTRIVVGGDNDERDCLTVVDEDGSVSLSEMSYTPGDRPVLDAAQVVMKIGLFVQFAYTFSQLLGMTDGVSLRFSIEGVDRPYILNFDPSDLTQFQMPSTPPPLASGEDLEAASDMAVTPAVLELDTFLRVVDELQADLFHKLRFPANLALGSPPASLRYSEPAVRQHLAAALRLAVFQG